MVKAKVSFLIGAVLLLAGCAPKPTSVGDHAGFTWQKFLMDGSDVAGSEDIETGVRPAHALEGVAHEVYDISGRRQQALRHGLNIIRATDGTTRKVLVK
jgi:hypothetical protein